MKTLNRSAFVIRPKDPYIAWAAAQDTDPPGGAEDMRDEVTVYLVPPDPHDQEETPPLRDYFAQIFAMELEAWSLDEATWPQDRTLELFLEWFHIGRQSLIVDLGGGRLKVEEF